MSKRAREITKALNAQKDREDLARFRADERARQRPQATPPAPPAPAAAPAPAPKPEPDQRTLVGAALSLARDETEAQIRRGLGRNPSTKARHLAEFCAPSVLRGLLYDDDHSQGGQ